MSPFEWFKWACDVDAGSPAAKAVLFGIVRHVDADGACWAGQDRIAANASTTERTVRDNLPRLIARRILAIEVRGGRSSVYRMTPEGYSAWAEAASQASEGGSAKPEGDSDRKEIPPERKELPTTPEPHSGGSEGGSDEEYTEGSKEESKEESSAPEARATHPPGLFTNEPQPDPPKPKRARKPRTATFDSEPHRQAWERCAKLAPWWCAPAGSQPKGRLWHPDEGIGRECRIAMSNAGKAGDVPGYTVVERRIRWLVLAPSSASASFGTGAKELAFRRGEIPGKTAQKLGMAFWQKAAADFDEFVDDWYAAGAPMRMADPSGVVAEAPLGEASGSVLPLVVRAQAEIAPPPTLSPAQQAEAAWTYMLGLDGFRSPNRNKPPSPGGVRAWWLAPEGDEAEDARRAQALRAAGSYGGWCMTENDFARRDFKLRFLAAYQQVSR